MCLDIETKSVELAKGVVECHPEIKEAEGVIGTAYVKGATDMLEAIEKNHYIVEATRVSEADFDNMDHEMEVMFDKDMRKQIDDILQMVKAAPSSRERSLAITKLQEGIMWLGMDLKRLNEPNPYPSSKDPSTGSKIEPTADGLKM